MARGAKPTTPSGGPGQSTTAAPSGQYGQGVKNQAAMKAVPLAKTSFTPPPMQTPGPGVMPQITSAPPGMSQQMADQAPMPQPGSLGGLTDPSTDGTPISHGADFGPGPNFSDLPVPGPPPTPPVNPQIDAAFMVNYLPVLESRASQPDSSFALRAWVRRLRSSLPPDFDPTALQTVQPSASQQAGPPVGGQ